MSAYPPEWQIHDEADFESFHLAPGEDGAMGMVLLAKLNKSGNFNGTFRCCVFGGNPTTIRVPVERVLGDIIPAEVRQLKLEFQISPEEMSPEVNSTTTVWKDGLASLKDRTMLLLDENNDVADPQYLIRYLKGMANDKNMIGGFSTRWAISATPSTSPISLQAELQVLPAGAKHLTKANLRAENCVSVQIARIPLRVEMFDGVDAAGPIPTLFAADKNSAFNNLMQNLAEVLEGVNNLNSKFLFMEHIGLADAMKYLQGPAKKAKGVRAFKPKPETYPPPRQEEQAGHRIRRTAQSRGQLYR